MQEKKRKEKAQSKQQWKCKAQHCGKLEYDDALEAIPPATVYIKAPYKQVKNCL